MSNAVLPGRVLGLKRRLVEVEVEVDWVVEFEFEFEESEVRSRIARGRRSPARIRPAMEGVSSSELEDNDGSSESAEHDGDGAEAKR